MDTTAIALVDEAGVIRYWNPGAVQLFGHRADQAIGSSLDLIVPAHLRERHWAGFRRAWTEGISDLARVVLIPVLCEDGEVRAFPGSLVPVRAPHGALQAVMAVWEAPSDKDEALFLLG